MSRAFSLFLVVITLVLVGCNQRGADTERLLLTGSSTMAPLLTELAIAFENQRGQTRIDVQTGGSSRGITDVRRGLVDIGMVSRSLNDKEDDLQAHLIAQDGIGLILNTANPVVSLTDQQIVNIYTGAADNWQLFGGANEPITVVSKAEGRSTLDLFLAYFKLPVADLRAHIIIGDNEQGIKAVAGNAKAIGYVSIGAAEYSIRAGLPIKLIPVNGVQASTDSVSSGLFPLSRPLNLVTRVEAKPGQVSSTTAADFIRFAQSDKARALILRQYFVPPQG
ncbi:MAG: phosphate ABC transporter substrate-binding protein [Pseudomonadales bacterium]|nr:phosphate ABC transporter substrate-binding protein [Pseudomonadales bacterium]